MFKILVLLLSVTYAFAGGSYGGAGLGLAGGLTGGLALGGLGGLSLGHGAGLGLSSGGLVGAIGLGNSLGAVGPVTAAIHSRRSYEVIPVNSIEEPAIPQVVDVEPSIQPVHVIFRTASSPVLVQQIHTPGAPGLVDSTHSEDEPHRVLHEVLRPVIQEVREVIQPYRRVVQEVRPVLEEVQTVVAKGDHRVSGGLGLGLSGKGGNGGYGAPLILDDGLSGGLVGSLNIDGGYGGIGGGLGGGLGHGGALSGLSGGYKKKARRAKAAARA